MYTVIAAVQIMDQRWYFVMALVASGIYHVNSLKQDRKGKPMLKTQKWYNTIASLEFVVF